MIILFKKDDKLFVKCNLNLKKPVKYQNKVFEIGNHVDLLLPEEVMVILTENGNVKIWNGRKFVKLNLGQFNDVMVGKLFNVEVFVEEQKQKEVIQPKVEVKPPVVEEPKEEVKEEIVPEVADNKKKRHKQNQGGDK